MVIQIQIRHIARANITRGNIFQKLTMQGSSVGDVVVMALKTTGCGSPPAACCARVSPYKRCREPTGGPMGTSKLQALSY